MIPRPPDGWLLSRKPVSYDNLSRYCSHKVVNVDGAKPAYLRRCNASCIPGICALLYSKQQMQQQK